MSTETVNGSMVVYAMDFEAPLLMPKWGYVASAFVLFLIGFFGFFLNLMVILLMFKDRQLWTPINIILFNLVCSDFSVAVLGNPFTLISALFHHWIFGHTMCVLYGFFMALLGITSITTLTVLSFERYMMVSRPLSGRHLGSKGAVLSIIFIWSYSLALTTPPLLGWGKYVNEAANISCSVNWHEQSMNTLTYILFLFAMGQVVPLAVISFSYINIIKTMKQNAARLGRVNRAEAKITAMVLVMIMSFSVAWTPYSVFALMEQFGSEGMISPGVAVIPALIAKSSICYDPLIYVGMNTQFRQSIKRFFGIHRKGAVSQTEKAYDNTLMSPIPKLSKPRDAQKQTYSEISSSTPKKSIHHKTVRIVETPCQVIVCDSENRRKQKLTAQRDQKSSFETDSSGETYVYNESTGHKGPEVPEQTRQHSDRSTLLGILNTDTLIFTQELSDKSERSDDQPKNVHNNEGLVGGKSDHSAYEIELNALKHKMKYSLSLDLAAVSEAHRKRKLSVQSTTGSLNTINILKRIFTNSSLNRDNSFNTFLCEENNDDSDDLL